MSAQWYYAVEGASNGPVSQTEFDELVATGAIRNDTLVWQEGMTDWLPYGRADNGSGAKAHPSRAPMGGGADPARADANTFLGALKDGFARYVDFKTRSTRSQYWWWTLWMILLSIGALIVDSMMGMGDSGPVNLVFSLATLLPSIAVGIRRLHDIGRTGWWILLWLVPIIGWIVMIVFYCTKSQEYENQWGPAPQH